MLVYFATPVSRVMLFWIAFVLTRPLGATMGDLMTKTHEEGGFDFGTIGSSAVLGGVLLFFIILSMRQHRKLARELPGDDPSMEILESEMEGR